MSRLSNIKPNVPKVDISNYFWLIAGIPKAGKTSLFAHLVKTYYGDISKGLLLAFEKGYQSLPVMATDIVDWLDFEDVVEELVDNKDENGYKFIGIDTCDVMWEMAQAQVIKEWNQKNPARRTNDIGAVGAKGASDSGYGVGYNHARQKIKSAIDKLMKAGYGIMALTHSKDKEIEEKNGLKYDQLVCSLPSSAREIFVNMADFIIFVTIEKEKIGESIVNNRYLYWRTDGYVEAGSRFKNVPERIQYDVDKFIATFENAVKTEFDDKVNLDKLKKEQEKQRDKSAKEYIKNRNTEPEEDVEELRNQLKATATKLANAGVDPKKIASVIGNPNTYTEGTEIKDKIAELNTLL